MNKVLNLQGVYASGVLIADIPFVDKTELLSENKLMVHFVESGSIAESKKIQGLDFLDSANGKSILSMKALYTELEKFTNENKKIHLIFKRLSGNGDLFSYRDVEMPVNELQFIGR